MSTFTVSPSQPTVDADNPWPGLLPYTESDRDFFRGREVQTEQLVRLILRDRLTVLFGLSGVGKSSLLTAGVFPRLRARDIFPVYIRLNWDLPDRSLSSQVVDAITTQAQSMAIEAPEAPLFDATLWEYFHRRDADFWNSRNQLVIPLLVLDQFEEIFTLGNRDTDRRRATEAFLRELADVAEGSLPVQVEERLGRSPVQADDFAFDRHDYKILISLRDDYVPALEDLTGRISAIAVNRMRLSRMDGKAALSAVDQAPQIIDRDVAEEVVRFVAAETERRPLQELSVEPALLSLLCTELNRQRKGKKISIDLLKGNAEDILSNFYERSFVGVGPEVREFVEDHLITRSGGAREARDSAAIENVLATVTRDDIDLLVKRRLVRIEDRGGGERIELTHDRLIGVVRASRDARWEAQRKKGIELAHQEARRRERERWRDLLLLAFIAFALIAAVLAVYAYNRGREAEAASSEARKERAEAEKQRVAAERERAAAQEQSKSAREQKRIAVSRADELAASNREEERLRQIAQKRENEAKTEAEKAEQANRVARKAAQDAQTAAAAAEKARADESKQRLEALDAKKQADRANASLNEQLAKADVLEASRRIDLGLPPSQALAYVAHALENDPDSLAAQSLAYDLLLRGGLKVSVNGLSKDARTTDRDQILARLDGPATSASFEAGKGLLYYALGPWRCVVASGDRAYILKPGESKTAGRVFEAGDQKHVNSVALSPDNRWLLTASQDGIARLWDVSTRSVVQRFEHRAPVITAKFDAAGDRVVTASWDKTAIVWDRKTGQRVFVLEHKKPVTSAVFDLKGDRVLTGCWDGKARIWALPSRTIEREVEPKSQVNAVAFSADGSRFATASDDGTAQVWEHGQPIGAPLHNGNRVNSVEFGPEPEGSRIVTGSDDGTARIWDGNSGTPISVPLRHGGPVNSASFSSNGTQVITASDDGTVRVWEVRMRGDPKLLREASEAIAGYDLEHLSDLRPLTDREAKLKAVAERVKSEKGGTALFLRSFFSR